MNNASGIKTVLMTSIVSLAGLGWLGCSHATPDSILGSGGEEIRGSGIVAQEVRPVSGFFGLKAAAIGHVYIEQGGAESLTIRAEDNLLPYLRTEMRGGNLVIRVEEGYDLQPTAPIEYFLTVRSLEYVELAGVGDVRGSNLDASRISLVLSGVGELEIFNLNTGMLEVANGGVGDVRVSGVASTQYVALERGGGYEGRDLQSAEADVVIRENGSASVRVSDRLHATITGSGNVYYVGDPEVSRTGEGRGEVEQIG
jgi:hypothetical protein